MWWRCAKQGGPFKSCPISRAASIRKLVNKRAFESLARAGAFDSAQSQPPPGGGNSDRILLGGAQAAQRERESGQVIAVRRRRTRTEEIAPAADRRLAGA